MPGSDCHRQGIRFGRMGAQSAKRPEKVSNFALLFWFMASGFRGFAVEGFRV